MITITTTENTHPQEAEVAGTAEAQITWFPEATAVTPVRTGSLQEYIDQCRSGTYQDIVLKIRQAAAANETAKVGMLKRRLPAATLSCSMVSRSKNAPIRARTHSGWLQCDFDGKENLGLVQDEIRARLQADPHVGAVFVGPSGVGIKCAVRIDGTRHLASFNSAKDYFAKEYGLQLDKACKDIERLCFLSFDPEAWCRQGGTKVLPVTELAEKEVVRAKPVNADLTPFAAEQHDMSIADVREILTYIPKRPDYDTWLRVASGVFSVLPLGAACAVLNEWAPEEHPGEYEKKHKNRLKNVTIRTVIHYAQQQGFDARAAAKRKTWMGRLLFGDTGASHSDLLEGDPSPPDLTEEEKQIVGEDGGMDLESVVKLYTREQVGDATVFLRSGCNDFAYDPLSQVWRKYAENTGLWTKDSVGSTIHDMSARIISAYDVLISTAEAEAKAAKNKEVTKANMAEIQQMRQRCGSLQKAPYMANVLGLAQRFDRLCRPATEYDQHRHLLGLKNGVCVDFREKKVRPTERADLLSVACPVVYDADATCPYFDAFIQRAFGGDADMIDYWWRIVGYSLTGFVDHDALFFCYGLGANGKSTGLMALRYLLGDQLSTMVDVNTLLGTSGDATMDYKKAMLEGKRLIITDELPDNKKINESMVKGLLGGEDIVARRPYERPYTFSPTHKIWMVGNHKPKISGVDHGIWRRIHLIPWEVTIPVAERKPRSEIWDIFKQELPGMLLRAIDGYLDFEERGGLCPPAMVKAATEEYRMEEDSLQQFMSERVIEMPGAHFPMRDLFTEYKNWCAASGETSVVDTANKLTRALKQPPYSISIGYDSSKVNVMQNRILRG